MEKFDIVLVSVPWTVSESPTASLSVLKACVMEAGFDCKTIDFNIRFQNSSKDSEQNRSLGEYFLVGENQVLEHEARQLAKGWANEIIQYQADWVGISSFCYQNNRALRLLCDELRHLSTSKIVVGGAGLIQGGLQTSANKSKNLGRSLLDDNLCDYYIRGEGDVALPELMKGNTDYPGINSDFYKQTTDIGSFPMPNFDDYNFEEYSQNRMPITFSRGCVRKCTFCDIHEHWPKYTFRKGEEVAKEMIMLHEKYGIRKFGFTDSLINGALREFNVFIEIMAKFNQSLRAEDRLTYEGQFIVRKKQFHKEKFWKDIKDSGAELLWLGVETGSDQVRDDMDKDFANSDLDYSMEMIRKYDLNVAFLIIVGYPTETEEHFQQTMEMFDRYRESASTNIRYVVVSLMSILPNTPVSRQSEELGLVVDDKQEVNWISLSNPGNTLEARLDRLNRLVDQLDRLGYTISDSALQEFRSIEAMVIGNIEKLKARMRILQKMRKGNGRSRTDTIVV